MASQQEKIRVGLIGPSGAGKTHFLHAFLNGRQERKEMGPTLAVEFYERIISTADRQVTLRMWDSSGNQKFRAIVPHHLRECEVIILMYDLVNPTSLNKIQEWIKYLNLQRFDLSSKKLLVIGNKLDLVRMDADNREVTYEQIKHLLTEYRLPTTDIYEVSSLQPSVEDAEYIRSILWQIFMEMLKEDLQGELLKMRVQLGKPGIMVTQNDHTQEESYCGECSIY